MNRRAFLRGLLAVPAVIGAACIPAVVAKVSRKEHVFDNLVDLDGNTIRVAANDDGEFYGKGIPEMLEPVQQQNNKHMRDLLDAIEKARDLLDANNVPEPHVMVTENGEMRLANRKQLGDKVWGELNV